MSYEPLSTHTNFLIPISEINKDTIKEKQMHNYQYVNKNNELIGNYKGLVPYWVARKVLKQIFYKTGERSPIFEIINLDTNKLYKYAGEVIDIKKKILLELINSKTKEPLIKKIMKKHKYIIRQIQSIKLENIEIE